MRLNRISLKDKKIFAKYLGLSGHDLSVYAFENIYIWKGLFEISWQIIEDSLCVFFKDKVGAFLYLAPLARKNNPQTIQAIFEILDNLNKNKEISRIENVEEQDLDFYRGLGFVCRKKSHDYLGLRNDFAALRGNKFKSKRASFNYFIKHNDFCCQTLSPGDKNGCLKLYQQWSSQRKLKNQEAFYQGMLDDSRKCLEIALGNYARLDFYGIVIKISRRIKAFTFGYKLNPDTFCILYEVADLSLKGLPQYIFSRFCRELKDYRDINIMDDSGLENLRLVKLSYHPVKLVPAYIVARKND